MFEEDVLRGIFLSPFLCEWRSPFEGEILGEVRGDVGPDLSPEAAAEEEGERGVRERERGFTRLSCEEPATEEEEERKASCLFDFLDFLSLCPPLAEPTEPDTPVPALLPPVFAAAAAVAAPVEIEADVPWVVAGLSLSLSLSFASRCFLDAGLMAFEPSIMPRKPTARLEAEEAGTIEEVPSAADEPEGEEEDGDEEDEEEGESVMMETFLCFLR